jgi:hypothetical protein
LDAPERKKESNDPPSIYTYTKESLVGCSSVASSASHSLTHSVEKREDENSERGEQKSKNPSQANGKRLYEQEERGRVE